MKLSTSIIERKPAMAVRGGSFAIAAILIPAMSVVCMAQTTSRSASSRASIFQAGTAPSPMDSISRPASDGKTLHITVGHAIFVDTKTRLRRVYVADPNILNSVTLTPNEIVVTAMAPGISSLTLLDEAGQAQNYVVSADLDIDGLRAAMEQAMGNDSVKVEGGGGRVTLTGVVGSPAAADSAAKLAALYAKDVVNALTVVQGHPKQVRLEVRILEVDRTKLQQWGINLFNPGGNTNYIAATTTSQYPSSATLGGATVANGINQVIASNPLNFFLYSAKLNLGATIQDLENKQIAQILAEPNITTVSGVKADFLSGGEFPFPVIQPGGNGGAPVVTISFRPFGVKLEFTPVVNADGTITLTVAPEVSALDYSNSVNVGGFSVPALSTRRASTEVELRSDQSFAISGLLDQRTTDILDKTPGVASIPILGALFKSKNINHQTTELIVVVTPTVLDPLAENTVPDQPVTPVPMLDDKSFDKSLGKHAVPNPTAPPITPDKPPMGNQAPPPLPAPAPAATPAASTGTNSPAAAPAADTQTAPPSTNQAPATSTQAPPPPAAAVALVAPSPSNAAPAPAPGQSSSSSNAAPAPHSMVEIMALSHESDAEVMVAALNRHGYQVAVHHEPQDSLLHLDVGPFANEKDAETMRQRLLSDGYNATIK